MPRTNHTCHQKLIPSCETVPLILDRTRSLLGKGCPCIYFWPLLCFRTSAVTWWFLAELPDELVVPPEVLLHDVPDHLLGGHLLTCPAHAINQSISKPNPRKQQNSIAAFYLGKF
jgi:hypothetical protein